MYIEPKCIPTCFQSEEKPRLLDFAMVSRTAQQYVDTLDVFTKIKWRPHLAQVLTVKGRVHSHVHQQLMMPRRFVHPPTPKRLPDPDSKRQKEKAKAAGKVDERRRARQEAEAERTND